ncbi:C4-dicarboxylic acid transporter DauA [Aestuariirhabdus litorea]|uniref:C4-dicarboxylic acid transporter DauA n=1 Tax=Aestuariirhabdus litorea TaxID=2528527 RepID=A0A3P3VNF4_9GAMM|nr:C4-dicarboxylic acid transporter DauA [Aestuariirhabdus litorea]RRJ83954.1 C4-dicarboxylic acid transporter DauA [Aestuariirhabdus litorea]RWW97174.1 C4-dicarboxylic acid transporter DauA [Endozoicomonadaceae bacterium GTF-13]
MFSALKKSVHSKPRFPEIQANVLAGLTVGVIALPLSMALAIASGVAPQYGLYTAIVAGIVIALSGGSKVNISGPTAAFVVVLLPIVQQYGLGGLLMSGLMAGLILVLMGVGKLGRLIEIVPYPVTVGFTAGIGVVIATFQVKDFLGLHVEATDGHYLDRVWLIVQALSSIRWQETLIALLTLGVLLLWPRLRSRIPGHLVALLVGSLAAWLLAQLVPGFSVATIGSRFSFELGGVTGSGIPPLLPAFDWPWHLPGADGQPIGFSFDLVRELLPAAITIAILGALESLLCAVVADGMSGKKHNPNDELIGQGIGNLVAPFFGAIPATAAIARTTANIKSGGSLPLASVVHALFILVSILLLAPILSYIPMASMAALLMMVAWNMSEARHFIRTAKVAPRDDVVVLLICFSLTVLFDMTLAVAVGMGLAAMLFIKRSIRLTQSATVERDHAGYELPASVTLYDINGPLFFGSAQKALKTLSEVRPEVRVVVLDMTEVTMLDMSAIIAMESIRNDLQARGTGMVINGLQSRMILKLRRAGIRKQSGRIAFSRTLEEGLAKAQAMH